MMHGNTNIKKEINKKVILFYELFSPEDEDSIVFEILVTIYQVARCNIPQDTMEWLKKRKISQSVTETRNEPREVKSKR